VGCDAVLCEADDQSHYDLSHRDEYHAKLGDKTGSETLDVEVVLLVL